MQGLDRSVLCFPGVVPLILTAYLAAGAGLDHVVPTAVLVYVRPPGQRSSLNNRTAAVLILIPSALSTRRSSRVAVSRVVCAF